MNYFLTLIGLGLSVYTCFAQAPPILRNPFTTNNAVGTTNVVLDIVANLRQYAPTNGGTEGKVWTATTAGGAWSNAPAGTGGGGPSTSNNIPGSASYVGGSTNFILDCGATNLWRMTLTQNSGIILTNCIDGQKAILEFEQSGAVLYTAIFVASTGGTWTNNVRFNRNVTDLNLSSNSLSKCVVSYRVTSTTMGASNVMVDGNNWGY